MMICDQICAYPVYFFCVYEQQMCYNDLWSDLHISCVFLLCALTTDMLWWFVIRFAHTLCISSVCMNNRCVVVICDQICTCVVVVKSCVSGCEDVRSVIARPALLVDNGFLLFARFWHRRVHNTALTRCLPWAGYVKLGRVFSAALSYNMFTDESASTYHTLCETDQDFVNCIIITIHQNDVASVQYTTFKQKRTNISGRATRIARMLLMIVYIL